jgi:hypothetical protein
MYDANDNLQHYGILGMKWGRRKLANHPIDMAVKALTKQRKPKWKNNPVDRAARSIANKHHEKNKNKRLYGALYNRNLKRYGNYNDPHTKAVLVTGKQVAQIKATIAVGAAVAATALYAKAVSPDTIRSGKNFILAMKRSPIRYADTSKFKNVIDL